MKSDTNYKEIARQVWIKGLGLINRVSVKSCPKCRDKIFLIVCSCDWLDNEGRVVGCRCGTKNYCSNCNSTGKVQIKFIILLGKIKSYFDNTVWVLRKGQK